MVIAIPAGIVTAVKRYSWIDHVATVAVLLGQSMPVFLTGIMLILLFAVTLRLLPASGWNSWQATVLPSITLGALSATVPAHLALGHAGGAQPGLRTHGPRQGLGEWLVIVKHALKNAIFHCHGDWPAIRRAAGRRGDHRDGVCHSWHGSPHVRAIGQLDFPVVQAGVLTLALLIVVVNFVVDLLYLYFPQVRIS